MLERIKKRALKKHMERNLKKRDLSLVNAKLNTLGFLVDEAVVQDFDALYDFSGALGLLPKDVKVFSFLEVKKKIPSLRQNQINNKDFNWKGDIHNAAAIEFLETSFDVLVGVYNGSHEFLDLMVSESKAKFKVGCLDCDARLFDLVLQVPANNIRTLERELKKYVTVLNKI